MYINQVSLLDSQLKEKSSIMEEYVNELSQLRSEMAKIKKNQEKEISQLKEERSRELEEVGWVDGASNCFNSCYH